MRGDWGRGCWALYAAWIGLACGAPAPPEMPHVVLLSVDTLDRAALRSFAPDAAALPHFDALAARARRFSEAYTPSSWTLPAHASLLSGWLPDRHGAVHPLRDLDVAAPSLAARLAAAGYQSVAFTEGGFIAGERGFARGFERYDEIVAPDAPQPLAPLPRAGAPDPAPDPAVFDRALAFLAGRDDSRPLFLFLHTYLVHDYWKAPDWATAGLPPYDDDAIEHLAALTGDAPTDPERWERLRALYRVHLARMDEHLGALLAGLERAGLADDTLFVLLSDHGEGLAPERGYRHHGGHLLPERLRVPLLVTGPGVVPGESAGRVSLVDVVPTLLDWLGLAPPPGADGRSLAAALGGAPLGDDDRPLFAFEYTFVWSGGARRMEVDPPATPLGLALLRGDRWYLRSGPAEGVYALGEGRLAPVTLESDAAAREVFAMGAARRGTLPAAGPVELSEEMRARLEALGYVLDAPAPEAPSPPPSP